MNEQNNEAGSPENNQAEESTSSESPEIIQETASEHKSSQEETAGNGKMVAILAYFFVGIVWYFADEKVKGEPFAKFHVKQSINIAVVSIVIHIVLSALMSGMYMLFPIIALLSMVVNLAVFVLWIMGVINAINDKQKHLPIIGELADKYLKF